MGSLAGAHSLLAFRESSPFLLQTVEKGALSRATRRCSLRPGSPPGKGRRRDRTLWRQPRLPLQPSGWLPGIPSAWQDAALSFLPVKSPERCVSKRFSRTEAGSQPSGLPGSAPRPPLQALDSGPQTETRVLCRPQDPMAQV